MNHIFIDASYFIFYRYHALKVWWKNAKQEELGDPFENTEFLEKFTSTFISKINEIPKKLKVSDYKKKNYKIYIGKDCPRSKIWRMKIYNQYKANRIGDEGSSAEEESKIIGKFFKYVYDNNLFEKSEVLQTFKLDNLEADDCIALSVKKLLKNKDVNNFNHIYIITSDADYLQLVEPNITIYNLKYKNIALSKNCFEDKEKNLFYKIVLGDKSDNIPSVFSKCGPKTVEKYFNNKELFREKLNEGNSKETYELNNKLINFNEIPQDLQDKFYDLNL